MKTEAEELKANRTRMVEEQLIPRGISDQMVLQSMQTVPRHLFVPDYLRIFAYDDRPLPIGEGQTISQPFIVALMAQALDLKPESRVMEIGTGSGYGAAVLSRIATQVVTIERHKLLLERAGKVLSRLKYDNIRLVVSDGSLGLSAEAPFERIIVTAAAPEIPQSLLNQLAPEGSLVIPVGNDDWQELLLIRRTVDGEYKKENLGAVKFVPLIGKEGH